MNRIRFWLALVAMLFVLPVLAQDDAIPAAEVINDEGGTEIINGEVPYRSVSIRCGRWVFERSCP